ncbi:flavodoxin domain-containing protein [Treponema sp.]|uniref:flavodoxin domain-containing protein n=1 Tax=Treponema sp. TaxID=166 RepID=UPI003F025E0A
MKTLIVYASHHHGNTKKLVDAISQKFQIDAVDAEQTSAVNLENYDLIGFASGIDFGKFYEPVVNIAKTLPAGKKVFAMFTCGKINSNTANDIKKIAIERKCTFEGKYGCKGYDTYGPFKLLGGLNKNHPDDDEIKNAVLFCEGLISK